MHEGVAPILALKTVGFVGYSPVTCCPTYVYMNFISLEGFAGVVWPGRARQNILCTVVLGDVGWL